MQVKITGKDIDLGAALRAHVDERLSERIHKYFGRPAESVVTFSREGANFRCDAIVHLSSGIVLKTQDQGLDAYAAFDGALARLEKRVRRYKRRLKNHHNEQKPPLPAEAVSAYVLAPFEDDGAGEPGEDEAANPAIIIETREQILEMTVNQAVMQLDLTDAPVVVFKNAAHGRTNVIYRRPDGNVGWIDPNS